MAQKEHLQIYKSAYDVCLYFEKILLNFSRYHKYSIGADLRDGAREVLKLVVRANSRRDKIQALLLLREELEELKVLIRLCHDVKTFNNLLLDMLGTVTVNQYQTSQKSIEVL